MTAAPRKLRVEQPVWWDHHRGGWRRVVELVTEAFHDPGGVRFVSAVEDVFAARERLLEPWVGFIHQVPRQHLRFPDLERLQKLPGWTESLAHCQGLWVLSEYLGEYLRRCGVPVPVERVLYPSEPPGEAFSFEAHVRRRPRRVIFVGEFLRRHQHFFDLRARGVEKVLLRYPEYDPVKLGVVENDSVRALDRVSDDEYDRLLADSVVFLSLADAGANTTIVECLGRTTPVLVNRVGGVAEYLGDDYPLYFRDLDEAARKLENVSLVRAAHEHMWRSPVRAQLTEAAFLRALPRTAIYRSLPLLQR